MTERDTLLAFARWLLEGGDLEPHAMAFVDAFLESHD